MAKLLCYFDDVILFASIGQPLTFYHRSLSLFCLPPGNMGKTAYPVALNFWNYWWKLKVDVKSPASASREAFIATSMARSLHNRTMYFWASPLPREHGLGFHLAGPRNMVSRSGTGNPKCPHPSLAQHWACVGPWRPSFLFSFNNRNTSVHVWLSITRLSLLEGDHLGLCVCDFHLESKRCPKTQN